DQYPNITVRTGHITGLRMHEGRLVGIQLDTALDPGNAGGPVLNLKGRIIGIIGAEAAGGGIPDTIPVTDLYKLLAQVQVTFSPPTLLFNRRNEPQQFLIRVETLGKVKGP